jgi:hypothetical protein
LQLYYSVRDVAKVLGWGYLRTWRWVRRTGIFVRRGGRLVTTRERLVAEFPEVMHRITEDWADREFGDEED